MEAAAETHPEPGAVNLSRLRFPLPSALSTSPRETFSAGPGCRISLLQPFGIQGSGAVCTGLWDVTETETKLVKRDLVYAMNGGGTLYAHAQARNGADLEMFLARFAGKLPLPEGKGGDEAMARLDKLSTFVKNLKPDKEICPEHMEEDFHNAQKDLLLKLTEVKNRIGSIPSKTAAEIAAQVVSEATWLDFPNDAKKD